MVKRALNSLVGTCLEKNLSACGVVLVFKAGKRESVITQEKHYFLCCMKLALLSVGRQGISILSCTAEIGSLGHLF